MEIKFNALKRNIAEEFGMLDKSKLEVVKQEIARVSINVLGIRELKWTGMGEFNLDDHYI